MRFAFISFELSLSSFSFTENNKNDFKKDIKIK